MYTLWISLPTQNAAGDITITNGMGKFYTFYWGVGETTEDQLIEWIKSVPIVIKRNDIRIILQAYKQHVLFSWIPMKPRSFIDYDALAIVIEEERAKNLPSIKDIFPHTHNLLD